MEKNVNSFDTKEDKHFQQEKAKEKEEVNIYDDDDDDEYNNIYDDDDDDEEDKEYCDYYDPGYFSDDGINNEYKKNIFLNLFSSTIRPLSISEYKKGAVIGKGTFSKVYRIKHKLTRVIYTAKMSNFSINRNYWDIGNDLKKFINGANILSNLSHPTIIKLIGCSLIGNINSYRPAIITKFYSHGSLSDLLDLEKERGKVEGWNDTMKLLNIYGIASAMAYLHEHNILHRNLKPSNVIIDDSLLPKLTDFDLSIFLSNEEKIIEKNHYGTAPYIAPEIWNQFEYSKASDVYSFAMLAYEIVTGKRPFDGLNAFNIAYLITQKNSRPKFKKSIVEDFKHLIESCWNQDPEKRPTFKQIVENLKTNQNFITEKVDKNKYRSYIRFIDEQVNKLKPTVDIEKISPKLKQESIRDQLQSLHKKEDEKDKNEIERILRLLSIIKIDLKQFQCIKSIGVGGCGNVFKIQELNKNQDKKENSKFYAAKILNRRDLKKLDFVKELKIQYDARHPLITKIIGYSLCDFDGDDAFVIISEFIDNGSLEKILENERRDEAPPPWTKTMKLINIYGIASAISHLHSLNILHLDLKPLNILLDEYIFPKLCDFGLSNKLRGDHIIFNNFQGTCHFAAPEIYSEYKYSKKSDVYAFGMILYEIVTKKYPFEKNSLEQISYTILFQKKRPPINKKIPKVYKNLIESCWNQDPQQRPDFESIVENLRTNKEFIEDDVDEELYQSFIKLIDQDLKGIDETAFKKYNLKLFYDELPDDSSVFTMSSSINLDIDDNKQSEPIYEDDDSRIHKMQDKKSDQNYSVSFSKYPIEHLNQTEKTKLKTETNELLKLKHPAIQKFFGFSIAKNDQDSKQSFPITVNEYLEYRTLESIIHGGTNCIIKEWTPTKKLITIYGVASGMKYLHSHNLEHPRLNPKTIIVDSKYQPKIIEVGEVTRTIKSTYKSKMKTTSLDSTFCYLSPEKLRKDDDDDDVGEEKSRPKFDKEKSDVYTYSLVVYEIITGERPFKNNYRPHELIAKIIDEEERPILNDKIPSVYQNLFKRCWSKDSRLRPTFSEIVNELETNDEFITKEINKDEYQQYIQYLKDNQE